MRKILFCTFILPAILLNACSSDGKALLDEKPSNTTLPDAKPITLRKAEKVTTDNAFAFDLFRATSKNSDKANVFISPLSVSIALNMTLNGAAGQTKSEMQAALRETDYTLDDINEYNKSLSEALLAVDSSTTINITNSIWYRQNFIVKEAFIKTNQTNYNAEVKSLDFASPEAVTTINNWCAKQTNGKIPKLIDKIQGDVFMYLINAVYFKGIWRQKFDKENTSDDEFYKADGTNETVAMMNQTYDFAYTSDINCGYLEMNYGNKAFSMIVMLPNECKTTQDVIDNLNNEMWKDVSNSLSSKKVHVRMPRFKLEAKYSMEDKILPEMGMKIPFTNLADFPEISEEKLMISKVIHKTFVQVDEEGTEAAAVTGVEMIKTSIEVPQQIVDFYVNKPFVFAIREKSTGVILFIGEIGDVEE